MARDDDEPVTKRRRLDPLPLDRLGIEELLAYVDELRAEIARTEIEIQLKGSHRTAADAFFKRP